MKPLLDLTDKRFGRLLVISEAVRNGTHRRWNCVCDCGNEVVIMQQSLRNKATRSCGCFNKESSRERLSQGWAKIVTEELLLVEHKEKKRSLREIAKELGCTVGCIRRYMDKFKIEANDPYSDIAGQKIEMLTVLDMAYTKNGCSYWNCLCDCGTEKVIQGHSLVRAAVVSCGCWNRSKNWKGVGDLSYSYWNRTIKSAKKRNLDFSITIEAMWQLFLEQEKKCALSGIPIILDPQYSWNGSKLNGIQTASIDRIDSKYGYIKENVQWVHTRLNVMKSNLELEEFRDWCKLVAKFSP